MAKDKLSVAENESISTFQKKKNFPDLRINKEEEVCRALLLCRLFSSVNSNAPPLSYCSPKRLSLFLPISFTHLAAGLDVDYFFFVISVLCKEKPLIITKHNQVISPSFKAVLLD